MIDYSAETKVKSNVVHKEATLSDNKGAIFSILTESVYSQPRIAGIREIVSNALDSSVRANSNRPINVIAPNSLNPTFSVRDYGVGLTDMEIYSLYTSLGSSSKKEVENEIGFFGIGALSPLAYVESFNVTSFRGGLARVYSIFMGENGVPQVAFISESRTEEPSGLCVSYNVKRTDIDAFIYDINTVLTYIVPGKYTYAKPITYYKDIAKASDKFVMKFDDSIFISSKAYYGAQQVNKLVMGGVCYEFDPSYLNNMLFKNYNLLIEAPIGAVSIQASREKLKLNAKTLAYIKAIVDFIYSNIEAEVQKQVDASADFWSALRIVKNMTIVKLKDMKWNGQLLSMDFMLKEAEAYFDLRMKYRKQFVIYDKNAGTYPRYRISSHSKIVLDDTKKGALVRIKELPHDNLIVFVQKSSDQTDEFIKIFGNLFTERASNLPEPPRKQSAQRSKKKIYQITTAKVYYTTFTNCVKEFVGDVDKFDGYYVTVKNRSIIHGDLKIPISAIYEAKSITNKDILVIDWEQEELPPLASPFLDFFTKECYSRAEAYYKSANINRVKNGQKLGFLYNTRKDLKESVDAFGKVIPDFNIDGIKVLANFLKCKLPEYTDFQIETKINNVVDKHYPLLNALNYSAYEKSMIKHLEAYILSGNQEAFKNCLN